MNLRKITLPLTAALAFGLTAISAFPVAAEAAPAPYTVKAMVLTLFPPETQPWQQNEKLTHTFTVNGAYSPVWCADDGLCVTTTGMGKVNASLSTAAIVANPQFDFSQAVFISSGIAGTPPQVGTLGDAAWADWVVDWDLGHHLLPVTAPTPDQLYVPHNPAGTEAFKLNTDLVSLAYNVTKGTALMDSDTAAAYRALYPGQEGRTPAVLRCDTLTGDDYWHGAELSATATAVVKLRTGGLGNYCSTAMEDTGVAGALQRTGYLDRYVSLRTMSNFDQPHDGQSVTDSLLHSHSGGFPLSIQNEYRVGSAFAHYVIAHGEQAVATAHIGEAETAIHAMVSSAVLSSAVTLQNESTMVSATELAQTLGATVQWLPESRTVRFSKNGTEIDFPAGQNVATVGGVAKPLAAGVQIRAGHSQVPIRFVAEALGYTVTWDQASHTVHVQ